jgi:hypothetical protein
MARARKRRLFPIALIIESACEAIGVSRTYLVDCIERELEAHKGPSAANRVVRVLVADLVEHVRQWPRSTGRKRLRVKELLGIRRYCLPRQIVTRHGEGARSC